MAPKAMSGNSYAYTTKDSLRSLEGLEPVRVRPNMYIEDTGEAGLHQLIWELVDNSVDEGLAGYCTNIAVTLQKDGGVSVADNGRGIPVDKGADGVPGLELVLTKLHAGGKFGHGAYQFSGGLHGVGISVVNALSKRLVARVARDGWLYEIELSRGHVVKPLRRVRRSKDRGTSVTFWPDEQIFADAALSHMRIAEHLTQTAFLNPWLTITFSDEMNGGGRAERFHHPGGLSDFVRSLCKEGKVLSGMRSPISFAAEVKSPLGYICEVQVAMTWQDGFGEVLRSFANGVCTEDGGTHAEGFRSSLTKAINEYARDKRLLRDKESNLTGDDVREGLVAVVSVKLPDPQFHGQTKSKLVNMEMRSVVAKAVSAGIGEYLDGHPKQAKAIVTKGRLAAKARKAASDARERIRKPKTVLASGGLPGKLADCAVRDAEVAELFIVEGDSAGGSAKMARDRMVQAVLPLRGKILNVERVRSGKALSSDTIRSLVSAIGTGTGKEFDLAKARYHKVIIMTDADVDGAHIRILLLTFFYRFMRPIIEAGYVYVAQPPLYQIKAKGAKAGKYLYTDEELEREARNFKQTGRYTVQRYKGLGEMDPEQLWHTTMEPKNRIMLRVTIEDAAAAEDAVSRLMGANSDLRREFIQRHAHEALFIDA